MEGLLVQLISGALGGNLAGTLLKGKSLGALLNTVVGLIGGVGGGQLMDLLNMAQGAGLAGDVGGAAVGGGLLMSIVGMLKKGKAAE